MLFLSIVGDLYAAESFIIYENCQLVDEEWNDGDSFHVKLEDGSMRVFRLYGVDCIETQNAEAFMKSRLDTQAYYFGVFGKDSEKQRYGRLLELGKHGAKEAQKWLGKPFKVITKNKPAGGVKDSRSYCYVIVNGGRDLGELLVSAGLARVYGYSDALPDVDEGAYRLGLYDLEMMAITLKSGVWKKTVWRDFVKERKEYRKSIAK